MGKPRYRSVKVCARSEILFVLLFLLVVSSPALALDLGDWIPGLTLSPFISQRIDYETNVFQAPTRAQDDVILVTVPGFVLEFKRARHSLSAGYRAEILRFLDLERQNTEHHSAGGQLRLNFPRLQVSLRDEFTSTSDPPGTELTGRIESTTNVLAPEVEYRLTPRFSAGMNYSWTHVNFERTVDELDRNEHLIGVSVFWKFLPKTDLRLNYSYGLLEAVSATERDALRHAVSVGLRGDLTAKLSSTFRVGFETREAERRALTDFSGYTLGGDWTYTPTARTTIFLLTDRSVQESTFRSNLFFVSTTGTLVAEHQFVPKLSTTLRLTVGMNDYPTKETVGGRTDFRNDILLGWGAGMRYGIGRWLQVGAEYSHTRRNSNFKEFDFEDDKIAATITLKF